MLYRGLNIKQNAKSQGQGQLYWGRHNGRATFNRSGRSGKAIVDVEVVFLQPAGVRQNRPAAVIVWQEKTLAGQGFTEMVR